MLSPAMLGIVVENCYDGVLKKQSGILHSTKHEGIGIGWSPSRPPSASTTVI